MVANNSDFYAGRYILENLFITTEKGDQVDISNLFIEINIYASVYDQSNVVTVTLTDALNVLSKLPIKGGCYLNFALTYKEDTIEYIYRVVTVKNINTDSNQRAYTIECISEFAYQSNLHKISKSYTGTTAEIALDVLKEYAPNEKVLYWEKSRGVQNLVIPNWSPMGTVNWLASRSLLEDTSLTDSIFSFYQDSQGAYNFIPIPVLIKIYASAGESFNFILNSNKTVRKTDGVLEAPVSEADYFAIDNLTYYDSFDIMNAYQSGYLGGTAFNYDLVNKNFDDIKFDYSSEVKSSGLLNSFSPFSTRDPKTDASHTWNWRSSFLHNGNEVDNEVTNSSSQIYNSLDKPVQSLTFTIRGNAGLDIGQIVNMTIPSPEPYTKDNENILDQNWSGRYYVKAIRHIFDKTQHKTVLDVTKESTNSEVDV